MRHYFSFYFLPCLLMLSACGSSEQAGSAPVANAQSQLPASAPSIEFTTFRYLSQDKEIVEAFQLSSGIRVNVNVLSVREIIAKAQADQLAGDVVLVPSLEDIVRLKNFGQLQPFYVDAFRSNVDEGYQDDQGYYAGLSRWTMAAIYNPNAVALEEVRTYKGVATLPSRGIRIGLAHPDSSGLAATVAGISRIVNDNAAALWTKIMYESAVDGPSGSDYDQLERMLAGELDLAFVSSGAAIRWFLNGNPQHFAAAEAWRVKYPHTETDQINFYNMTCIGVVDGAPSREQALAFVDYLFQKEQQETIGNAIFEYPTEAFSLTNDYLLGVFDIPGREINADELEQRIPLAWSIINRVATGE